MNIISVKRFCENYLDFHVEKPKSLGEGLFLGAKFLTFLTGIIPLIVGVTLVISDITLWYRNRNITVLQPGNQPQNVQVIQNLAADHIITPAPDNRDEVKNLNNAIVLYQEVPSAPSIPVVSREALERIKQEALNYNDNHYYVSHFPQETHELILSFLSDPQDLKNFALVSTTLHRRVIEFMDTRMVQIKKNISQLIKYANLLNSEIIRITDEKGSLISITPGDSDFKFDTEKWQKVIDNIKRSDLIPKSEWLDRICYLDLVEALAEYNIDSKKFNNIKLLPEGRVISRINILEIKKDLNLEQEEEITRILDEATRTLKGTIDLIPRTELSVPVKDIMLHALSQEGNPNQGNNIKGVFFNVCLSNRENKDWNKKGYKRHIGGSLIHLDWIIGKKQEDRILIPFGKEKEGDRQIILRYPPHKDRDGFRLERDIILGCLNLKKYTDLYTICYPNQDEDVKDTAMVDEAVARIKNAYGKELVATVAEICANMTFILRSRIK
jgi:hypothetical protein